MITLGFYFLLRPGEYASSSNPDSSPFRLQDVHLMLGLCRLHPYRDSHILHAATFVGLEFTTQKNGVRGEIVGLGRSGHATFCPVQAAIHRIQHLCQHRAPLHTPIYYYYMHAQWHTITTNNLTTALRQTATSYGCSNVNPDKIRLIGRWRSDEMLRYLHVQVFPVVARFAPTMLQHGHYSLIPNTPLAAPQPAPLPHGGHGGL
jgi:hypothetical protein